MEITSAEARSLEAYAVALQDLLWFITGENTCNKSYDPLTVYEEDNLIQSYAFNLKNGGRRHPLSEFENLKEIKLLLLKEISELLKVEAEEDAG